MISFENDTPEFRSWIHNLVLAAGKEPLASDIRAQVIDILADPNASGFAKSSAALLAGKYRIEETLPSLKEAFGVNWLGNAEEPRYFQSDATNAILSFGLTAKPILESLLIEAKGEMNVLMLAAMIFNVTKDKQATRQAISGAQAVAQPGRTEDFDIALERLETWRD